MKGMPVRVSNDEHSVLGEITDQQIDSMHVQLKDKTRKVFLYEERVKLRVADMVHGEMIFEGKVFASFPDRLVIIDVKHLSSNQRRGEVRAPIGSDVHVLKIKVLGKNEVVLPKPILLHALNVSASGLYFSSKLKLPIEHSLIIALTLNDIELEVVAEIVRTSKEQTDFLYGCRFVDLSETQSQIIRKYVFGKQSELRGKSL